MAFDEFLKVLEQFAEKGLDYVLVGGVALNLHGITRATEDIDLFVKPQPENIEKLRRALKALYDDASIDEITAESLSDEYPTIRYIPPEGTLYFDILTRLGTFASFDDLKAEEIEVGGVKITVATPGTLYWLKKDTMRKIDQADAEALMRKFDLGEK